LGKSERRRGVQEKEGGGGHEEVFDNKRVISILIFAIMIMLIAAIAGGGYMLYKRSEVAKEKPGSSLAKIEEAAVTLGVSKLASLYGQSAVALALRNKEAAKKLDAEAAEYGIYLPVHDAPSLARLRLLIEKAEGNAALAEALKKAGSERVTVYLGSNFRIGNGWVDVDVYAPPEKITEFLVGKQ
jgi:hypothetical protein